MDEGSTGGAELFVPDNPELTEMVQLQQQDAQRRASAFTDVDLEEQPVSGVTPESLETPTAPTKTRGMTEIKEKAFYASALDTSSTSPEDRISTYLKIKTELETNGASEDLASVEALLATETSSSTQAALLSIMQDQTIPVEKRKAIVQEYMFERSVDIDLSEHYIEKTFAARKENTKAQLSNKEFDINFLNDRINYNSVIQAEANKQAALLDGSTSHALRGFLELMIPFTDGIGAQIAREAAFGEEGWYDRIVNTIFSGENKTDFRAALERMPPEKRIEAAKRALEAIGNLPGAGFLKMILIEDMIASPEYATWQRGLDDVVGLLDTFLVGSAVTKPIRAALKGTLRTHPKSPLAAAKVGDPEEASSLAATAIADETGKVAEALGVTREEIIAEHVLPKHIDEALTDASSTVIDHLDELDNTFKDIAEQISTHGINYSAEEKAAARAAIREDLDNVSGLNLNLPNSAIINDGERYAGVALYSRSTEHGFSTADEAIEAATKNGIANEDIILFAKNPETGKIEKLKDASTKDVNEFFIGRKFDHVYNATDGATLGSDVVSSLGRTKYGGYLLDIVSRFDSRISSAFLHAKDTGAAIEKRMLDIIRKDIKNLSGESKLKLFKALEEGSAETEIYKSAILRSRFGLDEKEIKAYYSYRKVSDMLWAFTNKGYKKKLDESGMLRVITEGTEEVLNARPIKDKGSVTIKHAYDPITGNVKHLTDEEIESLYKNGGVIAKSEKMITAGEHKVTQVIVDNVASKLTKVPDNPLPYIKGWHQRTYKEYFYVVKIPKSVTLDGVLITDRATKKNLGETVASFSSETKAKEFTDNLIAETGEDYVWRPGKEFDVDPLVQDYQLYERNLRTTKKRGRHLAGQGDDALASIEDPIESLLRTVRTVSNHVSMSDVLEAEKTRWKLSYGYMVKGGEYPSSIKEVDKSLAKTEYDYGNAQALKQLIDMVEGAPAKTDAAWQGFMFDIASLLEKTPASGAAGAVRELGQASPTGLIRKLPSQMYIALRSLRQIMVQSGQLLQYTFLEPKYLLTGQAAREMAGISMAAVSRGRPWEKAGMKAAAKTFGVSPEEFSTITKTYFDKSGLPYSVDANFFVEGIVNDIHENTLKSRTRRVVGGPLKAYLKTVELGKRVGFDVGEFMNLTGSWLLSKRRWQKANPDIAARWSEKQYADVIMADARKIQYAMTQPGAFSYQKGILSVPLQFVPVQHKAILSMTANKYWSRSDKAKIFASNVTLFGAYGAGLNEIFDALQEKAGFEIDSDVLMGIKGGVMDMAFNAAGRAAFDKDGEDPSKVLFSQSFSPLSGGILPGADVFANFLNGDWTKVALGPAGNLLNFHNGRIARAIDDIRSITSREDISGPVKLLQWAEAIAGISSGYSDYMKWRIANHGDKLISASGNDLTLATAFEKTMLLGGFQLAEVDANYSFLRKGWDEEKELKAQIKKTYESMNRSYKLYFNGDISKKDWEKDLAKYKSWMQVLTDEEKAAGDKYMQQLMAQDANDLNENVLSMVLKRAGSGRDAAEDIRNNIMGSQMKEDQKQQTLKLLNEALGEEIF